MRVGAEKSHGRLRAGAAGSGVIPLTGALRPAFGPSRRAASASESHALPPKNILVMERVMACLKAGFCWTTCSLSGALRLQGARGLAPQ